MATYLIPAQRRLARASSAVVKQQSLIAFLVLALTLALLPSLAAAQVIQPTNAFPTDDSREIQIALNWHLPSAARYTISPLHPAATLRVS
jgi:hypothetical protein